MPTVWFVVLAAVITAYVVLDGLDLGAGTLHFLLGKTDEERGRIGHAIGPVWNGNEVWLVAGGGMLFMTFPKVYSGAFSGLYFGLILVLWLLVGRGLALEYRHQVDNPLWQQACDGIFFISSALLAFVLGVALANVVRGVPLGPDGYFHLTLFATLNWYALLVGALSLVVIAAQGAAFLAARTEGELAARARRWTRRLIPLEAVGIIAMIGPTYAVRHHMLTVFGDHPWTLVFPLCGAATFARSALLTRRREWAGVFVANSLLICALVATMAAGLYPWILPAHDGHPYGLSVHNAAAGHHSLVVAIAWFPIGMALAIAYFTYSYRLLFRSPPA